MRPCVRLDLTERVLEVLGEQGSFKLLTGLQRPKGKGVSTEVNGFF